MPLLYFKLIMNNPSTVKTYPFKRVFLMLTASDCLKIRFIGDLVYSFIDYVLLQFLCLKNRSTSL